MFSQNPRIVWSHDDFEVVVKGGWLPRVEVSEYDSNRGEYRRVSLFKSLRICALAVRLLMTERDELRESLRSARSNLAEVRETLLDSLSEARRQLGQASSQLESSLGRETYLREKQARDEQLLRAALQQLISSDPAGFTDRLMLLDSSSVMRLISKSNPVSSFDVILQSVGWNQKIPAIKAVRQLTGVGLKEGKDVVDHVPFVLLKGVDEQTAVAARVVLEQAGTVAIVPSTSGR